MSNAPFRTRTLEEELYKFDPHAHAVTVIQEQHRMVHDGMLFQTSGKQTGWLDAGTKTFLINVPADIYPHIQVMDLSFGSGDIDFVAREGVTTSNDGSVLPSTNVNRNSSNVAGIVLSAEPTITVPGTDIFTLWAPPTATGTGQSASGLSGVGQASEWVLAPSTKYSITLTNNSGGTIAWSYEFSWYEISYED